MHKMISKSLAALLGVAGDFFTFYEEAKVMALIRKGADFLLLYG